LPQTASPRQPASYLSRNATRMAKTAVQAAALRQLVGSRRWASRAAAERPRPSPPPRWTGCISQQSQKRRMGIYPSNLRNEESEVCTMLAGNGRIQTAGGMSTNSARHTAQRALDVRTGPSVSPRPYPVHPVHPFLVTGTITATATRPPDHWHHVYHHHERQTEPRRDGGAASQRHWPGTNRT
jgi:hypothetical protein